MFRSIFLTGLGGQGTVTLADLLAEQATRASFKVTIFHAKGMAQRGGRVTSEIRFCDDPAFSFGARISPGGADVLIGMETGETINSLPYLRKGGFVIALDQATVPVELSLKKASYPGLGEAERAFEARTGRFYAVRGAISPHNIFLLGVFAAIVPSLEPDFAMYDARSLEQAIQARLKRGLDRNLEAFRMGLARGRSLA
jgi:indolepyruvate ferredoxin oxidoreductase beta subunit